MNFPKTDFLWSEIDKKKSFMLLADQLNFSVCIFLVWKRFQQATILWINVQVWDILMAWMESTVQLTMWNIHLHRNWSYLDQRAATWFQEVSMLIRYSENQLISSIYQFSISFLFTFDKQNWPESENIMNFMNLFDRLYVVNIQLIFYDSWITFMVIISIVSLVKLLFIVWKKHLHWNRPIYACKARSRLTRMKTTEKYTTNNTKSIWKNASVTREIKFMSCIHCVFGLVNQLQC